MFLKTFTNEVCSTRSVCVSGPSLNGSCIATSRCDPNRGQRGGQDAAASPRCDPKRGQRGKRCCSSSFSTSLSAPNVAGDLHGSLDSGTRLSAPFSDDLWCFFVNFEEQFWKGFRHLLVLLVVTLWAALRRPLRARDVRGCPGLVKSEGMRKASGSKDSSVVVMHGHRMRSDFDLDSAFVPHSSSFSLCSSVVSEVRNSSHSINSCGEHGSALGAQEFM